MSIRYRYAKESDVNNILNLERLYYVEKEAPPEKKRGIELFLDIGGKILLQTENNKLTGCIEHIPIKNINKRVLELSKDSPLRHVYCVHPGRYATNEEAIFIHGWINNGQPAKWLYKQLFRYHKNEMIGFVSIENKKSLKLYSDIGGKIIDRLPKVYSNSDAHYVLRKAEQYF